ncbi:PREDICTED: uncharacterized protein LOC104612914 isoform X2 [Nelumbo nucifera]|uniref:Uncharacterized protein LOC104612914 isoform X2 n=2 Tax=Nelumbo nucifera TaxID=4432 RepID=A0A1U8BN91_NELNU|nr:PREDICTED: uncharacterized protein LOC104612914 isoform X2 [Nelumbo nucifera]DAD33547.1 TPA_asm: hypothetical protein HUJ06_012398 [Nelumbo nucifera]
MEQLVNFIIRPPRADYNPKNDLLEQEFTLQGQRFHRKDLQVTNSRGNVLQCSHYVPDVIPEGKALPCVIYCHGNSLMYGAEDPSIAGMVLDSPFSDLVDLMMELVDTYKFRLPKFTVKLAIQYMRKVIQKKAKFDIMDLNTIKVANNCFVPALIGHAIDDDFIPPHHSDRIYDAYVGDKNIIKFEGDHNSPRPQFYFDSITIFFHNVLQPPKEAEGNDLTFHDYYDEDIWHKVHGVGYTNYSHGYTEASKESSTTEDAIRQLRSRRPMSRIEVPSGIPSKENQSKLEQKDGELDNATSSSGLISFELSNGHPYGPHVPTSIDDDDDDEYVEYTLDNLAEFPCSVEDEERMIMEAVIESLKDLEVRQPIPTEKEQIPNVSTSSPECSRKDNIEASSTSKNCRPLKMDESSTSATDSHGSDYERHGPDASVSSSGTKYKTPPSSINIESIGTSACRETSASVQCPSEGDRSQQDAADMSDGTRATLTVQKNPNNHIMDGLMHRWGLNFFKSS